MKDSYIQTKSSSRDSIFAEDNPGQDSRYLRNAQRCGILVTTLHRDEKGKERESKIGKNGEIHAEEFNIV